MAMWLSHPPISSLPFGNAARLCSYVPPTEQQATDAPTDMPTRDSFAGEQHILGLADT